MAKLTDGERQAYKDNLTKRLIGVIGEQPKGLTSAELSECWNLAFDYWTLGLDTKKPT